MELNKINRRSFIKQGAIGGTGIMIGGSFINTQSLFGASPMNLKNGIGGLVPVSLIEGANLLVLRAGVLKKPASFALTSDLHNRPAAPGNKGRIAGVLPVNDVRLVSLLKVLRDDKETSNYVEKTALAFGWICNNAIYNKVKNIYAEHENPDQILEVQLYHDAEMLKDILNVRNNSNLKEEHLGAFFNEILPRATTRVHTMIPADDGQDWVNRMTNWRRLNTQYLNTLAKVIVEPESQKLETYVVNPNFYNAGDEIITMVRQLENAKNIKPADIEDAIADNNSNSIYARALADSYNNIIIAGKFLNEEASLDELEKAIFN